MTIRNPLMYWMIASLIGFPLLGHAYFPVEPTIIHGNAIINTDGTHMTVFNSPNTILNWKSFSIDTNHSVYFQQSDANSVILNRVSSNDPSLILGSLGSNGHVWVINPYGVFFGENSRIDTAGLTASTLDISNIDFLAKHYIFSSTGISSGIRNQGEIHTSFGGRVWMLGDQILNQGLIQTPNGQAVLAAGKNIEFIDSGAPNVVVRVKAPENEIVNLGSLVAAGGNIDLHASIVNQEGVIRANSIGTDAAGNIVLRADQATLANNSEIEANKGFVEIMTQSILNNWGKISGNTITLSALEIQQQGEVKALGGSVTMHADTTTYLDGIIDVSNALGYGGNIAISTHKLEGTAHGTLKADGVEGGSIQINGQGLVALSSTLTAIGGKQGGMIEVTGDKIFLLNADLDASGDAMGGKVSIGRGSQGGNELTQAREVMIGTGSEIRVNGGSVANAKNGEIVVWSTDSTEYYGSLQISDGGKAILASKGKILKVGDILDDAKTAVTFDSKNLTITKNPPDNLELIDKVFSSSVHGQPELAPGDNFGASVALEGNLLAVGAPGDSSAGIDNQGAVYLFTGANDESGLTLQHKLSSGTGAMNMPTLAESAFFGSAIALDGDHLAVGAKGALLSEGNPGAVHLFNGVGSDFSGLTWQKVLTAHSTETGMPRLTEFDFFGTALALDGDRLLVGAAGDSTGGANRGAVHMFTGVGTDFSNLTWRGKVASGFKGIELSNSDFFGWSLALDGDRMVVGAFNDNAGGNHRGSVHMFTGVGSDFTNLVWRGKLTSGSLGLRLSDSDFFGWSVALNSDRMAIGAIGDDEGGKNRGATYLLASVGSDFSGLKLENKIAPDIKSDTGGFGLSLALDNERLVVGATESSGALYRLNWLPQSALNSSSGRQATVDTAIQGINAAAAGSRAVLDGATDSKILNLSTETSQSGFGRLSLAQMSLIDMQHLIDFRREFKRSLFNEAIYKLELDPNLSEVPYCSDLKEINSATCRISDSQREQIKSNIAKEQERIHKARHKAKIAILPQIERKFVVLFGVDQYLDKSIPALENTISDAEAVGQLFAERLGYEIRVIKNATKANIIQALNQLSIEMEVNDSVVIYYAGHGFINEKTGNGYWIPSDASAKDPATWISNTSISEMLVKIRSKQMVMISDSCYSGAFTKEQKLGLRDQTIAPEDILVKRSVVVMSSGGEEPVADEGRGGHSIFAWYLMQALRNVDNWKPGANIFEQVKHDVSKSFPQTPQYGAAASAGHEKGGDYLFEFRQLE